MHSAEGRSFHCSNKYFVCWTRDFLNSWFSFATKFEFTDVNRNQKTATANKAAVHGLVQRFSTAGNG